jgi:hypothetical protein
MAISYPLSLPTTIGIAKIELSAVNAIAVSRSPFTFDTQVHAYSGEMWQADITIPPVHRDLAESWVSFLVSLRGQYGTFLLNDPACVDPRGTATSATVSGSNGDRSISVTMTGTLLAGDYIQIGTGANATLHKVLQDQDGSGTLEIWPALRKNVSSVSVTLSNASGLFRLSSNQVSWSVNEVSTYGITFGAMEAI